MECTDLFSQIHKTESGTVTFCPNGACNSGRPESCQIIRLAVFDLDGTLAPIGKPIPAEIVEALRRLESKGVQIALCSGKPVFYLCGLLRQLGLKAPILLGENGADIQIGVDLPPDVHFQLPYSWQAKEDIRFLRDGLKTLLPHLWFQPNVVMLTPFSWEPEEHAVMQAFFDAHPERTQELDIYHHVDCFDLVPKGISKSEGLRLLGEKLGISPAETVAVGDGVNDYPMFTYAGTSLGIHLAEPERVTRNFPNIQGAMAYLEKVLCC